MSGSKKQGCQCDKCQSLCLNEPGWFAPGEAEMAATYLGLSMEEFEANYLEHHLTEDVAVLAPKCQQRTGACIFFDNGSCKIHDVKPFECRKVYGCEAPRRHKRIREMITNLWQKHF